MAVTVSCTNVRTINGKVYVDFSDGAQIEFSSLQSAKDFVGDIDTDPQNAKRFGIGRWLKLNPTGANPNSLIGHSCTIDLTASPVVSFV